MAKKIPKIVRDIQNTELPEIDRRYQQSISYTQFSRHLDCPLKWSLLYKDGHYVDDPGVPLTFGTSMHEVFQHYLEVMYEFSGVKADDIDMDEMLEDRIRENYKKSYKKNNNTHFSNPGELTEAWEDGSAILRWFKNRRGAYFSKRGWHLVGCEVPLFLNPHKDYPNLFYKGSIDIVLYNEVIDKFILYDIKTSYYGWKDKQKKDFTKTSQLVLYKRFFSEQYNIPLDKIDVEYFIVKRKVHDNPDFPTYRIQQFRPSAGKNKLNQATKALNDFIEACFDKVGKQDKSHEHNKEANCKWCVFNKTHLCSATFPG